MQHLSQDQLEQWMEYYYENPQPDWTPKAIATLSQEGYLRGDPAESIIIFLGFIFRANPDRLDAWLSPFQSLPSVEKQVIGYALWYANTPHTQEYLANWAKSADPETSEILTGLLSEVPPQVEEIEISIPSDLDVLWSAFLSTGDEKYVSHLMSVLSWSQDGDDPTQQAIGQAARWSLTSNAIKHPRVRSICVNQVSQQPTAIAAILQEIITEVEAASLKHS